MGKLKLVREKSGVLTRADGIKACESCGYNKWRTVKKGKGVSCRNCKKARLL